MSGVIFDFNGTLFFYSDKHLAAWNQMAIELRGKALTEQEMDTKIKGVPNQSIIAYFLGNDLVDFVPYSLRKEEIYRDLCRVDKEHFHLVKGAYELFEYLKNKGIPFTIASASIIENIDFFVESFELEKWFDKKKIIYDDGSYINKVAMFKDAACKIGVDIADCVIFEDSLSGVKSAYEAGCRKIVVINPNKSNAFKDCEGVIKEIVDFTEIEEWF